VILYKDEKYGTDAFRIGMIIGNTPGTSLALSEDKIRAYKNFANKIWNIARFVLTETENIEIDYKFNKYSEKDTELIKEQKENLNSATTDMDNFRFYIAGEKLYHYIWHNFADIIIEDSKKVFDSQNPEEILSRKQFLLNTLDKMLKALHPFMPFVTEEIWQLWKKESLLMKEKWPV
jgi:valyl-tRNA synthetase